MCVVGGSVAVYILHSVTFARFRFEFILDRPRRRALARGRAGVGSRTLTRGKGVVGGSGRKFRRRSSDAELAAEDVVVVVDLDALVGVEVEFDLRRGGRSRASCRRRGR